MGWEWLGLVGMTCDWLGWAGTGLDKLGLGLATWDSLGAGIELAGAGWYWLGLSEIG